MLTPVEVAITSTGSTDPQGIESELPVTVTDHDRELCLLDDSKSFTVGSMLTQKTRYALRALLFLIEEGDGAVRLQRIAESQKIPRKYLELIMLDLKAADLVESVRGPKGGYCLTRHPRSISFGEVVRALEGPIALVSCASVNFYRKCDDCRDEATCAIRRMFMLVRDRSADLLNSITLEQGAQWESRLGDVPTDSTHAGLPSDLLA
jgi:Rrf2 family protein